jgi:hypothetical protein
MVRMWRARKAYRKELGQQKQQIYRKKRKGTHVTGRPGCLVEQPPRMHAK